MAIMQRMPRPSPKVQMLAEGLARGIDAFADKVPLTWLEALTAIEWARYRITESIIENPDGNRKDMA
jgi:hypothetical protein